MSPTQPSQPAPQRTAAATRKTRPRSTPKQLPTAPCGWPRRMALPLPPSQSTLPPAWTVAGRMGPRRFVPGGVAVFLSTRVIAKLYLDESDVKSPPRRSRTILFLFMSLLSSPFFSILLFSFFSLSYLFFLFFFDHQHEPSHYDEYTSSPIFSPGMP